MKKREYLTSVFAAVYLLSTAGYNPAHANKVSFYLGFMRQKNHLETTLNPPFTPLGLEQRLTTSKLDLLTKALPQTELTPYEAKPPKSSSEGKVKKDGFGKKVWNVVSGPFRPSQWKAHPWRNLGMSLLYIGGIASAAGGGGGGGNPIPPPPPPTPPSTDSGDDDQGGADPLSYSGSMTNRGGSRRSTNYNLPQNVHIDFHIDLIRIEFGKGSK